MSNGTSSSNKGRPSSEKIIAAAAVDVDCCYPFYDYKDHSNDSDVDPLAPLTSPGRVPDFPAKLHAILSHDDSKKSDTDNWSDIIRWMPHGRAWKIMKPREFEIKIIPLYYEHEKLTSFIRKVKLYGFRRFNHPQSPDYNCYYHPLFLRGIPSLCKSMRPTTSIWNNHNSKKNNDGTLLLDRTKKEPDLYKISEMHPIPDHYDDDFYVSFDFILRDGPNARMPIYRGCLLANKATTITTTTKNKNNNNKNKDDMIASTTTLTPHDQEALGAFQNALLASSAIFVPSNGGTTTSNNNHYSSLSFTRCHPNPTTLLPSHITALFPKTTSATTTIKKIETSTTNTTDSKKMSSLAFANQLAFPLLSSSFFHSKPLEMTATKSPTSSEDNFQQILASLSSTTTKTAAAK